MPRQKIYQSNADKCKAYRQRRREEGKPSLSNLERVLEWRVKHPIKYQEQRKRISREAIPKAKEKRYRERITKVFIAIDGEGITLNDKKNLYHYERNGEQRSIGTHYYTLMGASDGRYIENYKGLSTQQCLDFILSMPSDAILVGFAINYDVNMLLRDLPQDKLEELWKTGEIHWEEYKLIWMATKMFMVLKDGKSRVWYDVFGYFQKSFINALKDSGFAVPKEITQGKEDRKAFTQKQKDTIRKYNAMECDLLVQMMNKLRDAFVKAGFVPTKWYGAGTIASLMCERYGIRHYNATPNEIKREIIHAYYGGRNQILIQGEIGDCYIHDINSAYPAAMADLPTAIGEWEEIPVDNNWVLSKWGLHYVEWNLSEKVLVTPFPFRHKGRIYWPHKGKGWYWSPEVGKALDTFGNKRIKILKSYQFYPDDKSKPFDFIPELYEQRKRLIAEGNDAELAIKLGLNSMYGKAAQSIGFRDALPAYQNYFWAGYITSQTRARIFELSQISPKDIVFFSTDGIVSKNRLVEDSKEKILGGWDIKQLKNFFALQSGVYTFELANPKREEDKGKKHKSRGFNYRSVDYDQLRALWKRDGPDGILRYEETRFIGLGNALKGDFNLWRRWERQEREINFDGIGISHREGNCYRIIPPLIEAEESESYKLKGNWFMEGDGMEYLSLLDSQI
jgi:hypothetical protein